LCNFTTDIPSNVSVNTSATFSADATGTEGWDFYGGESVYWNFSGMITQGAVVEHTYTSMPDGGTTDVTVCVRFIQGPESCHTAIITVNETLAGYVSHSSQLQSVTLVGGGGVYFSANALGGLAPYTYKWQFDDGTSSTNESLVHEFSDPGVYNVTLVITDARLDQVTLGAQVEILEIQGVVAEKEVDTGDAEDTRGDVQPMSVALAGGGTLALILLTGYNGRKSRDKMMLKAQHKAQEKSAADADSDWEDDTP
jgi:PKD repeat protein